MNDLMIIILLFIFTAASFMAGYLMGQRGRQISKLDDFREAFQQIIAEKSDSEMFVDEMNEQIKKSYEKEGIYYDEPSGPIYRPTVKELNKMNEDEATKQAKEALKETFDSAGEPRI